MPVFLTSSPFLAIRIGGHEYEKIFAKRSFHNFDFGMPFWMWKTETEYSGGDDRNIADFHCGNAGRNPIRFIGYGT